MEITNYNLNTGQANDNNKYKGLIIILQYIIVIFLSIAYISYMVYILM